MTKQNFTEIVAIVDRSSSMAPLAKETILGFNGFLAAQKKEPGEAVFTLATFSDTYSLVHNAVPLQEVPNLNNSTYNPAGWTALLDAIGNTVNTVGARLASMKEEDRPSKILVLIMTDGEENRSTNFNRHHIVDLISHQRDKYSWEFVFIGANQDAITAGANIGIQATNSYNYTASVAGSASLFDNVTKGVSSYRRSIVGDSYKMKDPSIKPNTNVGKVGVNFNTPTPPFNDVTIVTTPPVTPTDPDNK